MLALAMKFSRFSRRKKPVNGLLLDPRARTLRTEQRAPSRSSLGPGSLNGTPDGFASHPRE
jgi:hypothetical protein